MKSKYIVAEIPLIVFAALYIIPTVFATLFNSHSDIGLVAIVVIVSLCLGYLFSDFDFEKGNDDNED